MVNAMEIKMKLETILYEVKDGVSIITFNRPDKMNAFNHQMIMDIKSATEEAAKDDSIRCVVLTGSGRGFSAGADLSER